MTEFAFPAARSTRNGKDTVTAFNTKASDPIFFADATHPNWEDILDGLRRGDANVWDLFDVASGVMGRFKKISDRYAWDGSQVLFDGDPVHSVFGELLGRALENGDPRNYTALAKFGEKLAANPVAHSREQAYDWLASHRFQITPDGDVVGYKSVSVQPDGSFLSGFASRVPNVPSAFVNGVPVPPLSRVPQKIGDTVSMPRSEVCHDPSKPCERGLHVGTRAYFGGFGRHMIEVHANPTFVVSVPTDSRGAKVRVHQYYVARSAVEPDANPTPVLHDVTKANVWAGDVGYKVT